MIGGDVKIVMTLDENGVQTKLVKLGEVVQTTAQKFDGLDKGTKKSEGGFRSLASTVKDTVFAVSIARFALNDINDIFLSLPRAIMNTAGEFQRMQKLMEGLSTQVDETKKQLEATAAKEYVIKMSMTTPFSITAIQDAFVKFKTGGIDPMNGSLQSLTDSVAKFGGQEEAFKRASVAIQQMAGKGVVSMEELRQQLGEAVPNAIEMMAQGSGMSIQKFTKLVSDGQVEATSALDRMFAVMAIRNRGAAEEMRNTWGGAVQQFKTNMELLKNDIANAGGDQSFATEAQRQLQELNRLFASPEIKRFAYDLGNGLAGLVRGIREAVPLITQMGQAFTIAGAAFAGYFGSQAVGAAVERIKKLREQAEVLARDPNPSGQGGFLSQTIEQYRRLEIEQERSVAREKLATQQKIAFNQQMIAENERQIINSVATERRAQAERVLMAARDLQTARQAAAEKERLAAATTQQAGKTYAEAIAFENRIRALDEQGKQRQGKKRANFVQQMEFHRQETIALQQKAVAMRHEAAAITQAAEAKYSATRAQKDYLQTAQQNAVALQGLNGNLNNAVVLLQNHAAATQRAATAQMAFKSVVTGFQSVFNAFGGWITVVISGLAYATQELMKFTSRWERADESRRRILDGVNTKGDVDEQKARRSELEGEISVQDREIARYKEAIKTWEQKKSMAMFDAQKVSADENIAKFQKLITDAERKKREIQERVNKSSALIKTGENNLDKIAGEYDASEFIQGLRANEKELLKELRASQARLDKAVKDAGDKARKENKNLTVNQLEEATKSAREAQNENVRQQALAIFNLYDSELKKLETRAKGASGKEKDSIAYKISAVQAELDKARQSYDASLRIGDVGVLQKDKKPNIAGAIADLNRESKESPALKYLEDRRVEFAKAKIKLGQLEEDARDIQATAQNETLVEILGKLASGDFDRAASKNIKAVEPGKNADPLKDRTQWIKQFSAFMEQGKGGALDFLATLGGLDVKLRESEDTVRSYFKSQLEEAGRAAQAKQAAEAMSAVGVKQEEIIADLAVAQREYNNAIDGTPAKIAELEKYFARLAEKLKLAGGNLSEFNKAKTEALGAAFEAEYYRAAADLQRKSEDVRIQSITNIRDREAELNKKSVSEINSKFEAQKQAAQKQLGDTRQYQDEVARLTKNRDEALRIQAERYALTSKTELQKLADSWSDTMTLMERSTVSWAEKSAEVMANMLSGQKSGFKDFAMSVLKDIQMISIKGLMADGFNLLNGKAPQSGNILTSIAGAFTGDTNGSGLPIDSASNAMRVVMVDGQVSAAMQGDDKGAVKPIIDNTFGAIRERFKGVMDQMGTYIADAFGSFKDGAQTLFSGLGSMLSSVMTSIMAASGGGGGGGFLGSLVQIGMTAYSAYSGGQATTSSTGAEMNPDHYDFANGGIMTRFGPVPLRAYARGGIATSPQLALYGEGSMNEAFVPLPDGRSIPVTMKSEGAGGATNVVSISITVNSDGQSSEEGQGQNQETWKVMAEKVRGVVIQELGTQKRPGGMLYGN